MPLDVRMQIRQLLIKAGGRLSKDRLYDASNVLGALTIGHWVAREPGVGKTHRARRQDRHVPRRCSCG